MVLFPLGLSGSSRARTRHNFVRGGICIVTKENNNENSALLPFEEKTSVIPTTTGLQSVLNCNHFLLLPSLLYRIEDNVNDGGNKQQRLGCRKSRSNHQHNRLQHFRQWRQRKQTKEAAGFRVGVPSRGRCGSISWCYSRCRR